MKTFARRGCVVALAAATLSLIGLPAASAHPLGNFTVNRSSGVVVGLDNVTVDHVVDFAEIPTVQERAKTKQGLPAYAASSCATAAQRMDLRLAGERLTLTVRTASARYLPGAAGLQTLRLECELRAPANVRTRTALTFTDTQATERVGWREITLQGDGTTLSASTAPTTSASNRLAAYPQDLLSSPLDVHSASATVAPGGARLVSHTSSSVSTRPTDRLSAAFTNLVGTGSAGPGVVLLAILLAIGIGAAHAVAPGHGKTVMAFYLAGERARSWRSALTVGATVTLTHTAGVLLLGLLVTVGTSFAPVQAYPLLSVISGVVILMVGVGLVRRVAAGRSLEGGHVHGPGGHTHGAHEHDHAHDHAPELVTSGAVPMARVPAPAPHVHEHHEHHDHSDHGHHDDDHGHEHHDDHDHGHHDHGDHDHHDDHGHPHGASAVPGGQRGLVAIGLAGGLVPSPSALVVLLGASATGHAWLGVLLVLFFGLGMAATLTTVGLLVSRAGGRLQASSLRHHAGFSLVLKLAPVVAATGVCLLGLTSVVRGISQLT